MKNAVPKNDKKRRKQLTEDVAKLEAEMEKKHKEELEQLKLTSKESKVCLFLLIAFESSCPLLLNRLLYKIVHWEGNEVTDHAHVLPSLLSCPGLHACFVREVSQGSALYLFAACPEDEQIDQVA